MKKQLCSIICILVLLLTAVPVKAENDDSYNEFQRRYESLSNLSERANKEKGLIVLNDDAVSFKNAEGKSVRLVTVKDESLGKVILCITGADGSIAFKTNRLAANNQKINGRSQRFESIEAISFRDLDGDGKKDLIVISKCSYVGEDELLHTFKTADTFLLKKQKYYNNWKLTEKLNQYSMNGNVQTVMDYVNGENSQEFLYTTKEFKYVIEQGFVLHRKEGYKVLFEEVGNVTVYSGHYTMGGLQTHLIYLVDQNDMVCGILEPMKEFDSLVNLHAISFQDVNGDGKRDISILADYQNLTGTGRETQKNTYLLLLQTEYWFEQDKNLETALSDGEYSTILQVMKAASNYYVGTTND